jgi:4'-phosphopantetheinyl transferase
VSAQGILYFERGLWRDDETFRLQKDQAHVWSVNLERMPVIDERQAGLLSKEEWARSQRFERQEQVRAFLGRRVILRQLLARYASCRPADVEYRSSPGGKPLAGGAADGIGFSSSSSGSRLVLAFLAGMEIGVDVEELRWRPGLGEVALRYFNPAEQARLAGLPQDLRQRQFFSIWTRKEALAKLSGEGLAALDRWMPGHPQALAHELPLGETCLGHVATHDPRVQVSLLHWAPDW